MHHRICYGKEENLGQQYGYGAAIVISMWVITSITTF